MRIYIKHVKPNLKQLQKYSQRNTKYRQLYSSNGIFNVEETAIFMLQDNSCHQNIREVNYKSYDFIIDDSIYTKTKLLSQLPVEYISLNTETFEYSINAKSALKLIITKTDNANFPLQLYFETTEKLDEYFISQDLDELLMCFYS